MWQQWGTSYEQKRQALLDHFLPYRKLDIYCARIVEYLNWPFVSGDIVEKMWMTLQEIQTNLFSDQAKIIEDIRQNAQHESARESNEAEILLARF